MTLELLSLPKDAIDLAQAILEIFRQIPPHVGVSVVHYPENGRLSHLRFINVGETTVHGFRAWIAIDQADRWHLIQELHRVDKDVRGNLVEYIVSIPDKGIYLRPASPLFVPLIDLPIYSSISSRPLESFGDLRLKMEYQDADGKSRDKDLDGVVIVQAKLLEANSRSESASDAK